MAKKVFALLLVLSIAVCLAACGGNSSDKTTARSGDTITTAKDISAIQDEINSYIADNASAASSVLADGQTLQEEFDNKVSSGMSIVPVVVSSGEGTVTVAVRVSSIPNFASADVKLGYDPSVFEVESVVDYKDDGFMLYSNSEETGYVLASGFVLNNAAIDSIDFTTVTFKVKAGVKAGTEAVFSTTLDDLTVGDNVRATGKCETGKISYKIGDAA